MSKQQPRRPKGESGPASSGAFSNFGGQSDPFAAFAAFGQGGAASTSSVSPAAAMSGAAALGADVPPEFKQLFKRLAKRDSTTRVTACEELSQMLTTCSDEDACAVSGDLCAYVRRRHCAPDKHLRRALCGALGALFSRGKAVKKHCVRHLGTVLTPWLCLRHDSEPDIASAANAAWSAAFDSDDRSAAALAMCTGKVVGALSLILDTTADSLKEEESMKQEEATAVLENIHAAALRSCSYLVTLSTKCDGKLAACLAALGEKVVENGKLWELGESKQPNTRTAVYSLVSAFFDAEAPREVLLGYSHDLNVFMQNCFGERTSTVHAAMWAAALRWMKHHPEGVMSVRNLHATLFQKLYALLRKTSGLCGSAVTYKALLPFLSLLGTDIFQSFSSFALFADQLLGSVWIGLQSPALPISEFPLLLEAWSEVWRYLAVKAAGLAEGDAKTCAFLVRNHLSPVLHTALVTSFRIQPRVVAEKLGPCLARSLSIPALHTEVMAMWTSLCDTLSALPEDPRNVVLALVPHMQPVVDETAPAPKSKGKKKGAPEAPPAATPGSAYVEYVGVELAKEDDRFDLEKVLVRLSHLLRRLRADAQSARNPPSAETLSELYLLLGTCLVGKLSSPGDNGRDVVSCWRECDWELDAPRELLADFYRRSDLGGKLVAALGDTPAPHTPGQAVLLATLPIADLADLATAHLRYDTPECQRLVTEAARAPSADPHRLSALLSRLPLAQGSAPLEALRTEALGAPVAHLLPIIDALRSAGDPSDFFSSKLLPRLATALREARGTQPIEDISHHLEAIIATHEEKEEEGSPNPTTSSAWPDAMSAAFESLLHHALPEPEAPLGGSEHTDDEAEEDDEEFYDESDSRSEVEAVRQHARRALLSSPGLPEARAVLLRWDAAATPACAEAAARLTAARIVTPDASRLVPAAAALPSLAPHLPAAWGAVLSELSSRLAAALPTCTPLQDAVSLDSACLHAASGIRHCYSLADLSWAWHPTPLPAPDAAPLAAWLRLLEAVSAATLFDDSPEFCPALADSLAWAHAVTAQPPALLVAAFLTQAAAVTGEALRTSVLPSLVNAGGDALQLLPPVVLLKALLHNASQRRFEAAAAAAAALTSGSSDADPVLLSLLREACADAAQWQGHLGAAETDAIEAWCRKVLEKDEIGEDLTDEEVVVCMKISPAAGGDLRDEVAAALQDCVVERFDEGEEEAEEASGDAPLRSAAMRATLLLTNLASSDAEPADTAEAAERLAKALQRRAPHLPASWTPSDSDAPRRPLPVEAERLSLITTHLLHAASIEEATPTPDASAAPKRSVAFAADVASRALLVAYVVDSAVAAIDAGLAGEGNPREIAGVARVACQLCAPPAPSSGGAHPEAEAELREGTASLVSPAVQDAVLSRFVAEVERTLSEEGPSVVHEAVMALTSAVCGGAAALDFAHLEAGASLAEAVPAAAGDADAAEEGTTYTSLCRSGDIPPFVRYAVERMGRIADYPVAEGGAPGAVLCNTLVTRKNQSQNTVKAVADLQRQVVHRAFPHISPATGESLAYRGRLRVLYILTSLLLNFAESALENDMAKKNAFSAELGSTRMVLKAVMDVVAASLLLHRKSVWFALQSGGGGGTSSRAAALLHRDPRAVGPNPEYRESVLSMLTGLPTGSAFLSQIANSPKHTARFDSPGDLALASVHLLNKLLRVLPASPRRWVNDCESTFSDMFKAFVQAYLSPELIRRELATVVEQGGGKTTFQPSEELTVKVSRGSASVLLAYDYQDTVVNVKMFVPPAFPLAPIEHPSLDAQVTRAKAGLKEQKWRRWLMQMTAQLLNKSARLWDCVQLWQQNLTRHFEGQDACPICYQVVNTSTQQLPSMECSCCHGRYHKLCLYKWFKQSNNSTCPLCRSAWYSGVSAPAQED